MREYTPTQRRPTVPVPPPSLLKKYPWIFKGVEFEKSADGMKAEKEQPQIGLPVVTSDPATIIDPATKIDPVKESAPVTTCDASAQVQHQMVSQTIPMKHSIPAKQTVPAIQTIPAKQTVPTLRFVFDNPKALHRSMARISGINTTGSEMLRFFTETAPKLGFTERDGQIEMAEAVLDAIKNGRHLLLEAGVGIGKSYGYLVPVLMYHMRMKMPVVIATSTIALQEQLAADVKKLLTILGMKESFYVAKGQGNYLCSEKVHKLAFETRDENKIEGIDEILEELRKGHTDRKDLEIKVDDHIWKRVCIENYSSRACACCVYARTCEYHKMRSRLLTAGITICNQSLLTAHLINTDKGWAPLLNPGTGIIVVDEAHNLENNVRMSVTQKFSLGYILRMVTNANNALGSRAEGYLDDFTMDQIESTARALFQNIEAQALHQVRQNSDQGGLGARDNKLVIKKEADRFFFRDENGAYKLLSDLASELKKIATSFWDEEASIGRDSKDNSIGKLLDLGNKISSVAAVKENHLFWIEVEKKQFQLCYCEKDIAERIHLLFFERDHISVMTSATMTGQSDGSTEDKYAYFIRNTGFPLKYNKIGRHRGRLCDPIDSPFDYDHHAMIYHASDLPHPTKDHEAFIREGTKRLKEILDISEGRALVLFTSKEDMREVYAELRSQNTGYQVLMQKSGSSQAKILQKFKEDEHAVLLGTGSYWEGISIEGSTLSNVVIFRLPFPVPDPISTSREEGCTDPLMEVRVPEMVIKLKQGVGRLIRNETDKGIISILDSRLSESSTVPYKDIVWNALPIRNRTTDLGVIRDFYNKNVISEKRADGSKGGNE